MNDYRIAGASCRGTVHIRRQLPCQDVVSCWADRSGGVIVLADGAGSCNNGLEGARTAVETAGKILRMWCVERQDLSETELKERIVNECMAAMEKNPFPLSEQGCTLLFAAARDRGEYWCGHIGDGYAFLADKNEGKLLSDAENGEEPNITFFITSSTALMHFRMTHGWLEFGQAIVLCSDGAGTALYDRANGVCAGAVSRIVRWIQTHSRKTVEQALERSMDGLMRNHTSDDMSIGLICYAWGEEEMGEECEIYV